MNFLKKLLLVAVSSLAISNIYAEIEDLTDLFDCYGHASTMNIDDSGNVLVFINDSDDNYKTKIFQFTHERKTKNITKTCGIDRKDLKNVKNIITTKNSENPLVIFNYFRNKASKIFAWDKDKFSDISEQTGLDLENIESALFNNDPHNRLAVVGYHDQSKKLFAISDNTFTDITGPLDLNNISFLQAIAFNNHPDNPLAFIGYSGNQAAKIISFTSNGTFADISSNYPELANLTGIQSVNLINMPDNQVYVYISFENGKIALYCLDQENKSLHEISSQIDLKASDLMAIESLNFIDNSPFQVVTIIYYDEDKPAKLLRLQSGILTKILDTHSIDDELLTGTDSIQFIENSAGGSIIIINFDDEGHSNFQMLYDSELNLHVSGKKVKGVSSLSQ